MIKAITAFLQNREKKPEHEEIQVQMPTKNLKPKWPLNWIPPKDLRHPAWRYD